MLTGAKAGTTVHVVHGHVHAAIAWKAAGAAAKGVALTNACSIAAGAMLNWVMDAHQRFKNCRKAGKDLSQCISCPKTSKMVEYFEAEASVEQEDQMMEISSQFVLSVNTLIGGNIPALADNVAVEGIATLMIAFSCAIKNDSPGDCLSQITATVSIDLMCTFATSGASMFNTKT